MRAPDNSSLYKSPKGYNRARRLYEAHLALLQQPYETRFVDTPHGRTHVLLAGPETSIPVVLFHGNSLFGPHLAHQVNAIAKDYQVIVPDVIGTMGRSEANRPSRKGPTYGEWITSLLAALNIKAAHMVGISNGAWLIIKLATVASELICSAALMSASGFVPTSWRLAMSLFPVMLWGPFMSHRQHSRKFLKQTVPPGFLPSELSVAAMEIILRDYRRESLPGVFSDAELGCLTAPTYLLMGEHEKPFPPDAVIRRARAVLPNLQTAEILSGVGHGMVSENPQLVNRRLLDWLSLQDS